MPRHEYSPESYELITKLIQSNPGLTASRITGQTSLARATIGKILPRMIRRGILTRKKNKLGHFVYYLQPKSTNQLLIDFPIKEKSEVKHKKDLQELIVRELLAKVTSKDAANTLKEILF
jgi:predicted transcriptional regulator